MKRNLVSVLFVFVALMALVGSVSAAQINNSEQGYLGGDSLNCSSARGCWLLNSNSPAKGSVPALLGEFAQADIQAALKTCAADGSNVIIGTIEGTFGPFTLSAVYDGPNAARPCSLQANGFEQVGKAAKPFAFRANANGSYSSLVDANELTAICYVEVSSSSPSVSGKTDGYELWSDEFTIAGWSATTAGLPPC